MLRCVVAKGKYSSFLCVDNRGVIHNSTILDSILKKKDVSISYRIIIEAAIMGTVFPTNTPIENNFVNIMTKTGTGIIFWKFCGRLAWGQCSLRKWIYSLDLKE